MKTKRLSGGFTLIEMLVVMGIIAVLAGALLVGFGGVTKAAQRAKAQEAVSNAATALAILYNNEGKWPSEIISASKGNRYMDENVAKALAKRNLLGISCVKDGGKVTKLTGVDRWGIVDPWAAAVLKRFPQAGLEQAVPSGGTIKDHMLYFAIDGDGDGITEARLGPDGGDMRKIRATAVVWCAGRDGVMEAYSKMGRSDDVFSWQRGQEAVGK